MRRLIYSMTVSLDGFISGTAGEIDWTAPDEQLHRFHNAQVREVDTQLMGRRLYETMRVWERPEEIPGSSPATSEFAEIWAATPKLVFSRTLASVPAGYGLVRADAVAEVARLKRGSGGDLAVGGAGLAAAMIGAGLVDEYRLFVSPVVLGAGRSFFPPLAWRIGLELLETRTFGSGIVYLRFAAV